MIRLFLRLSFRKIRRGFLRFLPQSTLDLKFAGRPLPSSVAKLGNYSPPVLLESEGVLPSRPVSHSFQSRDYFSITNPIIDAAKGEVYLDSGAFLIQSTPWHPYIASPERRPPFIKPKKLTNPAGYIRLPAWTYYHQVVEYLAPYLFLKNLFPDAITLVPEESSQLATSILDDMGINYEKFRKPVSVNKLYFVEHGNDSGYPHPRDIAVLRDTLLPLANARYSSSIVEASSSPIYISRLNSERSPWNEEGLIKRLERITKIRVVESEGMGFLEQIFTFSRVHTIFGVHGAGLANQIWMNPGGKVIELVDLAYCNPVFNSLAKICNHLHVPIFMVETSMGPEIDIESTVNSFSSLG